MQDDGRAPELLGADRALADQLPYLGGRETDQLGRVVDTVRDRDEASGGR